MASGKGDVHRRRRQGLTVLGVSALLSTVTVSAPAAELSVSELRHAAAQAAGVTALHLCSGYFATQSPRALVDATLATNANPPAPPGTPVDVDERARTVSVGFADDLPPRIAVSRAVLGCTLLPIGATGALAATLVQPDLTAPDLDDKPWPMGDRNALAPLPPRQRQAVERLIDAAFADETGAYRGITWGIVVLHRGRIVAERYQHGFASRIPARTNSMCKSLGATLIGVGAAKGLLDLSAKAPLAEWRRPGDPRGAIDINALLHMASGLYSDGPEDPSREIYRSGTAIAEIAVPAMLNWRPGSHFVYAGTDVNLAVRALRERIGDDRRFAAFPYRELLWKIGMTRTVMETDWNNDFIVSGQCWSTARDFARLGMLYLADGRWGGERLLPAGWSKYVSTPAPAQPAKGGIGGDARYGAQFWLHGGMEGLPADTYSAFGSRGQYAVIIPSQDLVIVRRGFDRAAPFRIQKFAADIVGVLAR